MLTFTATSAFINHRLKLAENIVREGNTSRGPRSIAQRLMHADLTIIEYNYLLDYPNYQPHPNRKVDYTIDNINFDVKVIGPDATTITLPSRNYAATQVREFGVFHDVYRKVAWPDRPLQVNDEVTVEHLGLIKATADNVIDSHKQDNVFIRLEHIMETLHD